MDINRAEMQDLISRVSHDDKKAFEELFDLFYEDIYKFVRYFVSEFDAEDIVSESFISIWRNRGRLNLVTDFNAYIYTIARNLSYSFLHSNNKIQNVSLDELPVTLDIDYTKVDTDLLRDEVEDVYIEALNSLPERCKLIFMMVREDNLKHKEIADILQISVGTIEQQMNIAIRKLVEAVKIYSPEIKEKYNRKYASV
ncbi:MAG: RNA polymerase sigma factor [Bacteroidales bacterium]